MIEIVKLFGNVKGGKGMTAESKVIFGIYRDRRMMEEAVIMLEKAGFRSSDMAAIFKDDTKTRNTLNSGARRCRKKANLAQHRESTRPSTTRITSSRMK